MPKEGEARYLNKVITEPTSGLTNDNKQRGLMKSKSMKVLLAAIICVGSFALSAAGQGAGAPAPAPPSAPAPASAPTIHRQVLLPNGQPARGVSVQICQSPQAPASTIVTDDKGFCSSPTPYSWKQSKDGLACASVVVLVEAPGMALTVSNIGNWLPCKGEQPLPLYLAPAKNGCLISGKVMANDQDPIENAEVTLVDVTEGSMAPWPINCDGSKITALKTQSRHDGSFSLKSFILDTSDPYEMGAVVFRKVSATAKINGKNYEGSASGSVLQAAIINLTPTEEKVAPKK